MIERKKLLDAVLGNRNVTTVDVREITLAASQKTGRHLHPCTVVGYIASGTAIYQIEGESALTLQAGCAFHEPANTVIAEFSNASNTEPLTFIAFYLLDGEQELITILESR